MVFARIFLACLLVLSSCTQNKNEHSHDGSEPDHGSHDHDEYPTDQVTIWNDEIEIFMEHELFEVDRATRLIIHVTFIDGWLPKKTGKIDVFLTNPNEMTIVYEHEAPDRDGIYIPSVSFPTKGTWNMEIQVPIDGQRLAKVDIPVEVYGSHHEFPTPQTENDSFVSFLKEQQWKMEFETEATLYLEFRDAVQVHGKVTARPGGEAVILAPVAGRILSRKLAPAVGSQVSSNDLICSVIPLLNNSDDPASLILASKSAELHFAFADKEFNKMKSLFAKRAVPETRLQQAELEYNTAKAKLATARSRSQQYQETLSQGGSDVLENSFDVYSPIEGTVVEGNLVLGASVREGDELLHVVDLKNLMLEVRVPEDKVGLASTPFGAWIRPEGLDQIFEVSKEDLIGVGGRIDPDSRTLPILYSLRNNEKRELRVGMFAKVHLYIEDQVGGVAIKKTAVLTESGVKVVYVHISGESFERRIVKLGGQHKDFVRVVDGLAVGERVVTKGAYQVRLASTSTTLPAHGHAH